MQPVLDTSKAYFDYFEQICRIPHGSGNEKGISDFIVRFANEHGLWVYQDEVYNLIVKKPATPGYEHCAPILLQGHLDMVCEKNAGVEHDFEKDALNLYIDDEGWLHAKGTTLGADDGYGIAMMMAILGDATLQHPALECVFTVQEETGMQGAQALRYDLIDARRMVGLDAAGENSTVTTSAGGLRIHATKTLAYESVPAGYVAMDVMVDGLEGGHSGVFIGKERGNSIKIIARLLNTLREQNVTFGLCDLFGGSKDNAIPREATARIVVPAEAEASTKELIAAFGEMVKQELRDTEAALELTVCSAQGEQMICAADANNIISLLHLVPSTVDARSTVIELILTSDNVGVLKIADGVFDLEISLRSAVDSRMDDLASRICTLCDLCGVQTETGSRYPGMEYQPKAVFRELYSDFLQKTWGKGLRLMAIHAGTEGGYFARGLAGVEMVNLGPLIEDVHCPNEKMNVESFDRCAKLLIDFLESLKEE